MVEQYYIFSDETGHWNERGFYIRAWVILSEKEHGELKNKVDLFKKICEKEKELKFSRGHDYSIFCNLNFRVYFTLTFADDFRRINYDLVNKINLFDASCFTINNKNIKNKIINTIKNSIFLNIFEYYHIKNTSKFIRENYHAEKLIFFVDSPQYQNKEWKEIFKEIVDDNSELKIVNRSEDYVGIQFADILAGNLNKILSDIDNHSLNDFEKKIISNFSFDNGTQKAFLNNPQIIMWKPEDQEFVDKLKLLRE